MGDAGVMSGAALDAMTLSTAQVVTGAKTYQDQKLLLRNPASTFTTTITNPVVTANTSVEFPLKHPYKYFIYLDAADSKFKARNGLTGVTDYTSAGSTDAAVVIQNAINASSNAAGIIQLAANTTFPLVSTTGGGPATLLRLRTGTYLKGGGQGSTILLLNNTYANNPYLGIYGFNVNNVTLEDFTVNGQNFDGDTGSSGVGGNITFTNTDPAFNQNIWVNRVSSLYSAEIGIKAKSTHNFWVTNSYVEGSGLITTGPPNGGYAGIESVQNGENVIFMGNICKNCGGEAIGVYGVGSSSHRVLVEGNIMYMTADSSLVLDNGGRGHILLESDNASRDNAQDTIIANNFILAQYKNIHLKSWSRAKIYGNIITQVGFDTSIYSQDAIEIGGVCADIDVYDNNIRNCAQNGIEVTNALSRVNIRNNSIYNIGTRTANTYHGIWIEAGGTNSTDLVNCTGNIIIDDRGASKMMKDGVRVENLGSGTMTNIYCDDNYVSGETGSKYNVVTSGATITFRRNKGTIALNGGSATVNIPHRLSAAPSTDGLSVVPLSIDARGQFYVTVDATNIILNYPIATPGGTANLSYAWRANVQ